ncbi:MAG: rRNA maturation RNase YbeY [Armatimonadetes bacterium]|nr:rRNA maturation RNase YbeY [Armatimonadota bacterium]MDW8120853.1 rRNA maturation RNase YbeY [Armatimonadota bacterium]
MGARPFATITVIAVAPCRLPASLTAPVRRLLARVLEAEVLKKRGPLDRPFALTVAFCDEPYIRTLNKRFLGHNGSTDVLSFPFDSITEDGDRYLGDIVVCLPVAQRNARRYKVPLQKEVLRLTVHGLLHLLGHNDETPLERKQMAEKERSYLKEFLKNKP